MRGVRGARNCAKSGRVLLRAPVPGPGHVWCWFMRRSFCGR